MLQIKLLEIKNKRDENTFNKSYTNFVEALNKLLGYNVEIVHKQDDSFVGYYITYIGINSISDFETSIINKKSFLLEVDDSNASEYIKQFQPAGLISLRFFRNISTAIVGKTEVIEKAHTREECNDMWYEDFGYDQYAPIPRDGTYETVAKSILSYLEIYDKYLKNK